MTFLLLSLKNLNFLEEYSKGSGALSPLKLQVTEVSFHRVGLGKICEGLYQTDGFAILLAAKRL